MGLPPKAGSQSGHTKEAYFFPPAQRGGSPRPQKRVASLDFLVFLGKSLIWGSRSCEQASHPLLARTEALMKLLQRELAATLIRKESKDTHARTHTMWGTKRSH